METNREVEDYFAGQALAGFLACSELKKPTNAEIAVVAYGLARAMMKERESLMRGPHG